MTVGVLVLAGALAHAADVVIDFENLRPNTILSTQYHGLGVDADGFWHLGRDASVSLPKVRTN